MASYAENVSIWWRHHVIFHDEIAGIHCYTINMKLFDTQTKRHSIKVLVLIIAKKHFALSTCYHLVRAWHQKSVRRYMGLHDVEDRCEQRPLKSLRWRHNDRDGVPNHQPYDCLLDRLFRRRSKKISKLRVTGLCAGNSPGTGEFPAQMASYAENVSIWWRHNDTFEVDGVCTPDNL